VGGIRRRVSTKEDQVGSFVITLREGFEAALIVGIILACLTKLGYRETHERTVWLGVIAAIAFSLALGGVLFATVGELEGSSEAAYEATAMILAAAVVTWMVFWMRKQAATIGAHLRRQVSHSVIAGGGLALATVAFIGVAREGIETALFLFASAGESGAAVAVTGALLGLVVSVGLGVLFYRGALRLDLRKFFTITSVLVIAFAAYLLFSGVHELTELAGSEALELAAPLAALAYGGGFLGLYLRDARRPAKPPAATEHASA
jgi:high-affinity iron transporter